mmetsp:Transcript_58472/g.105078  ORF Transcript_58472/g.105078 Transcript_58472/m.105078 type:complete len:318 (-) Transcript_58472:91-1044(-)
MAAGAVVSFPAARRLSWRSQRRRCGAAAAALTLALGVVEAPWLVRASPLAWSVPEAMPGPSSRSRLEQEADAVSTGSAVANMWPTDGELPGRAPRRRAAASSALASLLSAPVALAMLLAGFLRPSPANANKVVDTIQYSAQETAGLRPQNNKAVVEKYTDLGEGLSYENLQDPQPVEGDPESAREVKSGDKITVDLVGRLAGWNGQVFVKTTDTSGFSEAPVMFRVGAGEAIPGLERGVLGMRRGGIRRIVIPPKLGYPRPCKDSDLGQKGAIPDPGASSASTGQAWELRNRLVNGVLNNSQRDDTLVIDVKIKRIS